MDIQDIVETEVWSLYEKGRNYNRITGLYTDTDRNYRMYNGNQWEGAKLGDVEPVQKNFIKPIVKYKQAVIHDNLYSIVFSSMNFEDREFRKTAEKCCDLLNNYVARVWEQDKMDDKLRKVTKDAAINDEGIFYVFWDEEKGRPVHEVIKKNDIHYGNENDEDIQSQPYILIRKRMPVANAKEFAEQEGASGEDLLYITGDSDTFEESGEAAKEELDDMVTVIYKLYKKDGSVRYSIATRYVDIAEDIDTGLTLYPVAHMTWEEKEGSARGEGEVRTLIPNQIEVNKTEMRRVLTAKLQAYPKTVADKSKIANPQALTTVGGVIWTTGQAVDDVSKIVGTIPPAQMSPDVKLLQDDLINMTRDLAGAGDTATGQVDPESASGRAILAVQQASQAPVTEQKQRTKSLAEDVARIDLEHIIIYSVNGLTMEEEVTDPATGEVYYEMVTVPQTVLERVQANVKVDVTPKSPFDRFAQEQTIENLLMNGLFRPDRVSELEIYYKVLPDDSVAPKVMIGEAIEYIKEQQRKIAMLDAQAQMMQQRAQQFLMEDVEGQAQQVADARMQLEEELPEEEYAEMEEDLDEETAEAEEEIEE